MNRVDDETVWAVFKQPAEQIGRHTGGLSSVSLQLTSVSSFAAGAVCAYAATVLYLVNI